MGDGRGDRAARTAVFDDDGEGDARVFNGCECDEPGVVFPMRILCGAGFARNGDIGQLCAVARAAWAVDHIPHHALHGFDGRFGNEKRRGLALRAFDHIGRGQPTRRQRADVARHLNGRRQKFPLSDDQVEHVTPRPGAAPLFVIGAVGQQAARFAAGCDVDVRRFPKAEHVGVPMPVFNAYFHAELIKKHIARFGEGLAQVDRSTALFVVTAEPAIAKNHASPARAKAIIAGSEQAHVQRGDRCDHFENRCGRIFALKAAVEQGEGRIGLQAMPRLGGADRTRVKTRFAHDGENFARLRIHGDQTAAHAVGKCVLGDPLHAPVEGEGYVIAGIGRCSFGKTAHFAALGIDLDVFDALLPAHSVFEEPLDPALSNLIVIAIAPGFQLGVSRGADQPHIAQDMRRQGKRL